ncbi:MAG: efflux RND transporter periplasmic adaptor subunit [Synechococcales bacterium]|nr:efflux RND transporter periplasmic adaptor subunit [Synechococcales bacterium]
MPQSDVNPQNVRPTQSSPPASADAEGHARRNSTFPTEPYASGNGEFNRELPSEHSPDPFESDLFADEATTKRRAGVQWLVASGLLLVAGLGGWFAYETWLRQPPMPVSVVTAPAQIDDLEITVTESGMVQLGGQQTFKAPEDATVENIFVEEGQRVSEGEVLLVLRARDLQQQLDNAQVDEQIARNELERDRERIQEQQAKLNRARDRLQESQDLLNQGYISEDEYLTDQNNAEDALSALRDAEVRLTNSELKLRNEELQVRNLQAQLKDTQILAPFDAVILDIEVNPGDGVQQEGELLTIGDPQQEAVIMQLNALNALDVKVNMPVRVSMIGPDPQTFTGRIYQVSPLAIARSNNNNDDQATIKAVVILDAPSQTLIPGSTVSVEIILDQRTGVVTVPIAAVHTDGGSPYVWVKDQDDTAQQRSVVTGLQNVEVVEITSGLMDGDEVVVNVPPDVPLTPGTPLADPGATEAGPLP